MARHAEDREDLMREATALVERVALVIPGRVEPVVVGFRRDGCASFYFAADPVYQFNTHRHLRRAYISGRALKAVAGQLVALERRETPTATELVASPLGDEPTTLLLQRASVDLTQLAEALAAGTARVVEQVPSDARILERIAAWLDDRGPIVVAAEPHAR